MSDKIPRVKSITKLYYSNPAVQKALLDFSNQREVVPRYYEGFGKRPDTLIYQDDVQGLVNKGATSFHASEEIWQNPLNINSEMTQEEFDELRHSWDLLIDIDSPYLDSSKEAAKLIIDTLEKHGIKNYGIKFSGSKGFHIIVPAKAFPRFFRGIETRKMFPQWPRAISEYLMSEIKPKYNQALSNWNINFDALKERTKLSREDVTEIVCPNCEEPSKRGTISVLACDRCKNKIERPNLKITKRKLKCIDPSCPGYYNLEEQKEYFFCENCGFSSRNKEETSSRKIVYAQTSKKNYSDNFKEEISASTIGSLDIVLVAPRHLFRMPYSLHEKTALASVVITKDKISSFDPKDANPLKVKVLNFYPDSLEGEAAKLLESALTWKEQRDEKQEVSESKRYGTYKETDFTGVTEAIFPQPIKKLLNGLTDGRKRGLFILLTFLKSLNFSPAYINEKVRDWNKKNSPPLKEGYLKSQIDWHLKQKKKILPPNYSNNSFYKDLKLIDQLPKEKNPIVQVAKKLRNK